MNIDKIWARHGSNDLWIEADSDGWQAHEDRGVLLERIAELETDRDHQLRARKDLEGVIRKRNRRIAELEGVIYRNCDSAQATDSDAKIIDELQLFFNVEVAAGGGQEICPRCNQEMGSPHYCRPDWSGPSIGGKVEVSDE